MEELIKMVRVEVLDPMLKSRNGPFMHMGLERARKGEKKGIWKIIAVIDGKEMVAGEGMRYLTRGSFKEGESQAKVERPKSTLKFEDLYGGKREELEKETVKDEGGEENDGGIEGPH